MEQRRLLLAALLSLAVLFGWQILFPPAERAPAPSDEPAVEDAGVEPSVQAEEEETGPAPAPAASPTAGERLFAGEEAGGAEAGEPVTPPADAVSAAAEERVVVETERYRAEMTNRGAQLLSFRLHEHESARGDRVDLVRRRARGPYPFALVTEEGRSSSLNDALFAVERSETADGGTEVVFRFAQAGSAAEKRFRFGGDGVFEVEVAVTGEEGWGLFLGPGLRNPAPSEIGNTFTRRGAVYRAGEELETVDATDLEAARVVPGAGVGWFGFEDTYFVAVLVPRRGLDALLLQPLVQLPGDEGLPTFRALSPATEEEEEGVREVSLVARARGESFTASGYWGAKQHDRMASLGIGLEETVRRGRYLGVLVGPLHWGLEWIHENVIANYGWAIVLMTVLIKLALLPLTLKGMGSMQKMQELNPKIQAIRQKYKPKLKDKQGKPNVEMQKKMNDEVMALYRSEGVNPAGGCLPMLLQIPILFAFYRLLYTSVELRHAPWVAWIQDLSAYDPYYVLPLVMGGTQFLQQRLTPTSGDPMQRKIFLLMPVVFTFLFLRFPAGLVLYWLTNNVLTIGQQLIYNRLKADDEPADGKPAKGKKGAKR